MQDKHEGEEVLVGMALPSGLWMMLVICAAATSELLNKHNKKEFIAETFSAEVLSQLRQFCAIDKDMTDTDIILNVMAESVALFDLYKIGATQALSMKQSMEPKPTIN